MKLFVVEYNILLLFFIFIIIDLTSKTSAAEPISIYCYYILYCSIIHESIKITYVLFP